jgi:hypothetical protein
MITVAERFGDVGGSLLRVDVFAQDSQGPSWGRRRQWPTQQPGLRVRPDHRETRPKTFVMENVPNIVNMLTPEGVPVLDAFACQVSADGYGDYQALRRALRAQAGVVVGTPTRPVGSTDEGTASPEAAPQLDLFETP